MRPLPAPPPAIAWLREEIAPLAGRLDQEPDALRRALGRSAAAGVLGAGLPGPEPRDPSVRFNLRAAAAQASGTFAFLLTQHWSAAGFAAHGGNSPWVERLARGEARSGIAYAHLRRPGPPAIVATPARDGLRLRGAAPWMTGWGIFDHCVTAARMVDGRIAVAIHPLEHPGVVAGPPMRLAAFESANTVRMELDLVAPAADVLFVEEADWLDRRDATGAAGGAAFVIGCAEAALALVDAAITAGRTDATAAAGALRHALRTLRAHLLAMLRADARGASDPREGLRLRAEAITLAGRLAHAAIAAWAGQANVADHAAQRVYREVLGFTVLAQTRAVRGATLAALAGASVPTR